METKIRNATLLDIPSLLNLAKSVGRFLCADEIKTWMQVDPEAFFVTETSPDGKLIGCCCGTRLSPELGFMGFYVVLEEYRGKGIGSELWRAAKEHLGGRNIGVHGNPRTFEQYKEKEGFSYVEDYTILCYECLSDSVSSNIILPNDIEVATYFEGHLIQYCKQSIDDARSTDEHETHNGSRKTENDLMAGCVKKNEKVNIERMEKSSFVEERDNVDKVSFEKHVEQSYPSSINTNDLSVHTEQNEIKNAKHILKSNICSEDSIQEFQGTLFSSKTLKSKDNSRSEKILSGVVAFDKLLHKRDGSLIVRQTFSWSACLSKVALVEGKVVGYACMRNVLTEYWTIAPFYADNESVAEILLFELLRGFDFTQVSKGIHMFFPDKNISCKKLIERFGFKER